MVFAGFFFPLTFGIGGALKMRRNASSKGTFSVLASSMLPKPPEGRALRDDWAIEVYADESSQTGHQYLVLGAITLMQSRSTEIFAKFAELRATNNYLGEIKWKKVSEQKIQHYRRWIDALFDLLESKAVLFHALVCDTTQFDHKTYNQGDGGIGFSKLLYQLLLHCVGKPYFGMRPVYGYLDDRTTKHDPEALRQMLNAGLSKSHDIHTRPFRRLTFKKSAECDLIQAVDLLIGAMGWEWNKRGERPEARKCKKELAEYIVDRMNTKPVKWRCKVWDFKFKK